MKTFKRTLVFLLALVLLMSAVPFAGLQAQAATSNDVASKITANLPIVTYAMPLSGASRVYSYTDSSLRSRTTGYYIDSFSDQIVITAITGDGKAVCVTYPTSSSAKFRNRWFAADDILGLASVSVSSYTASAKLNTYRMSGSGSVTGYGSISSGDASVSLGSHKIGSTTYYPTIYPISSGRYNNVSNVRHKLALATSAPAPVSSNTLVDVTASFAGKQIGLKSRANSKYISADGNTANYLARCNQGHLQTWETFTVEVTGDGWAGLKSFAGDYLSANIDESNAPVMANQPWLQIWESFRIYKKGNDYYLKSRANGKYLSTRILTANAPVQACGSGTGLWERYEITVVSNTAPSTLVDVTDSFAGKEIGLKSVQNGKYLSADSNSSGTRARCNQGHLQTWETFKVEMRSDGWAGLKAHNGKYLSANINETNAPVMANQGHLQIWESFRIYKKDNYYYLKSRINGNFLCVRVDTANAPVQAYANEASTWERFEIRLAGTQTMTNALYGIQGSGSALGYGYDGYVQLKKEKGYRHEGLDFARGYGVNVYSLTDGIVNNVIRSGLSQLAIYYPDQNKTVVYMHLSIKSGLKTGDPVKRGDLLGTEAAIGAPYGTHTHVEVRNGKHTKGAVSMDKVLDNPDPTPFWNSLGYEVK